MRQQSSLRVLAAVLAVTLPLGAYACGDAFDVFPGVLTIERSEDGPTVGVPASAEAWTPSAPERPLAKADSIAGKAPVSKDELVASMMAPADQDVVSGRVALSVVDSESGEVLVERDSGTARAPASTMKLVTSLAAIRTLGPHKTFTTSTRLSDDGGTVALVAGGDMLLTTKPKENLEGVPRASLSQLADETAAKLKAQGTTTTKVTLDDSYFSHDSLNLAWGDNGPNGGWVAPIMPIGIDGGRTDGEQYGAKSSDPGKDALDAFAKLLRARGITIEGAPARAKPTKGTELASVTSAPLETWIEHTLQYSDNTVAELLGRHVARETGHPTTVDGAREAVAADLQTLAREQGFTTDGLHIADNSGLSVQNRIAPSLLAHLTAWASGDAPARVRDTFALVPVGGLNGTLKDRFQDDSAVPARGIVRGKTGYLGGVASLAGTTVLSDGRAVGYSILVYGFDGAQADAARLAVDSIATGMVTAGAEQ